MAKSGFQDPKQGKFNKSEIGLITGIGLELGKHGSKTGQNAKRTNDFARPRVAAPPTSLLVAKRMSGALP